MAMHVQIAVQKIFCARPIIEMHGLSYSSVSGRCTFRRRQDETWMTDRVKLPLTTGRNSRTKLFYLLSYKTSSED